MVTRNVGLIRSLDELKYLVDKCQEVGPTDPVGFDIETGYDGPDREKASLQPEYGFITGYSIAGDESWGRYVPIRHDMYPNLDHDKALEIIAPFSGRLVAHNAPFEIRFLRHEGFDYEFVADTMLQSYVLSNWPNNQLKSLTKAVLHEDQAELSSLFPGISQKAMKSVRFNILDPNDPAVISYACDDSCLALALDKRHRPLVEDNFIYKLEMALIPVIVQMEETGVFYEWQHMRDGSERAVAFLKALGQEINADASALTGKPIQLNPRSPAQLQQLLFDELKMPVHIRSKKTKKPSTNKTALARLRKQYPVVQKIVVWKEMDKLNNTYLAKYPHTYDYCECGRTHPHYFQAAAITGRGAVSDPPYQQTPKKYKYELESGLVFTHNFRVAIQARPGYRLMHFDYSQVELRAITGAAQEPTLMEAFRNHEDTHKATASLMLGVPRDSVTSEMRDIGKTMNYALMYQMGVDMLAQRLAVPDEEAQRLYDAYFGAYSSIDVWIRRTKAETIQRGFGMTHFGRKATIWELQSHKRNIYEKGVRLAVNMPIQGWAADYMKIAMLRQDKARAAAGLKGEGTENGPSYLIMNNHDALTFEVRNDIPSQLFISTVTPAVTFDVPGFPPIEADWAEGENWGEMVELKVDPQTYEIETFTPYVEDNPFGPEEELDEDVDPDDADGPSVVEIDTSLLSMVAPQGPPSATQADIGSPVGGGEAEQPEGTEKLIVLLETMPTEDAFRQFMQLCQRRTWPGCEVVLRTPEGDVPMPDTWLPPSEYAAVSIMFGSAKTYQDAVSVSSASVLQGLSL